jgi:hypothetical protein
MDSRHSATHITLPRSSVTPAGRFIVGIHQPSYHISNLRRSRPLATIGQGPDGREVRNHQNFPVGDINVPAAGQIFEIANPLPFRGATFIGKDWADACANHPESLRLPERPAVSMRQWLGHLLDVPATPCERLKAALASLPEPVRLAVATTSTDAGDLEVLAEQSAAFIHSEDSGRPTGLQYIRKETTGLRPNIRDHLLFEAVANNPCLPDDYKTAMVLRPGVQGDSPITGEWGGASADTHVYEYLRQNSYIPWGHFAANMAEDAIRYDTARLSLEDVRGMRQLYYQRTFQRMARSLGLKSAERSTPQSADVSSLEIQRSAIAAALAEEGRPETLPFNATLWGWNFGFDYAPSRYRLHASHQQVHQQYALIPREVDVHTGDACASRKLPAYACGDLVHQFVTEYRRAYGIDFFTAYVRATRQNERLDGRRDRENSLVVHADRHVMLFVPKAQTSQWELQLVTLTSAGNVFEADANTRCALDQAIWIAIRTLGAMGARMVTTIEYAKRFDSGPTGQRLLYSFLPRLPESPGAFSEAQLRWIVGHYPEDFAAACRAHKPEVVDGLNSVKK